MGVYLTTFPPSFLDSEQRIIASKVIKRYGNVRQSHVYVSNSYLCVVHRYILHAKKTAFVIEHDFIMATYLADRVIVFEGQPAVTATAMP